MSHNLGRVVADGRSFDEAAGLDLVPGPGPLGGPRFVMLHFDSVNLTGAARLTVELGYGTDVFNASSGSSFWSRPVDTSIGTIAIRSPRRIDAHRISPADPPDANIGSHT